MWKRERRTMRRTAREDIASIEYDLDYVLLLVGLRVGSHPRAKLDPSDVVQHAILHAHKKRAQFRDETEGELLAWLRAVLANAL
jgi:RNA polymerase sigma-70 factor, ECF subfamily